MPVGLEETQRALIQFRLDILKALTGLSIEIKALQAALIESELLDAETLKACRKKEQKNAHRTHDRYAEEISPAHEIR